jgi:hypothetical protein
MGMNTWGFGKRSAVMGMVHMYMQTATCMMAIGAVGNAMGKALLRGQQEEATLGSLRRVVVMGKAEAWM